MCLLRSTDRIACGLEASGIDASDVETPEWITTPPGIRFLHPSNCQALPCLQLVRLDILEHERLYLSNPAPWLPGSLRATSARQAEYTWAWEMRPSQSTLDIPVHLRPHMVIPLNPSLTSFPFQHFISYLLWNQNIIDHAILPYDPSIWCISKCSAKCSYPLTIAFHHYPLWTLRSNSPSMRKCAIATQYMPDCIHIVGVTDPCSCKQILLTIGSIVHQRQRGRRVIQTIQKLQNPLSTDPTPNPTPSPPPKPEYHPQFDQRTSKPVPDPVPSPLSTGARGIRPSRDRSTTSTRQAESFELEILIPPEIALQLQWSSRYQPIPRSLHDWPPSRYLQLVTLNHLEFEISNHPEIAPQLASLLVAFSSSK